jgi:transposase
MKSAVEITLSGSDREKLKKIVNSKKSPVRLVEQSQIVLYAEQGKTNKEIAKLVGGTENKIDRWRNRFASHGFAGIEKDRPRGANHGGKNSLEQASLRAKIIE